MGSLVLSVVIFCLILFGVFFVSNIQLIDLSQDMDKLMHPNLGVRRQAYRIQKNKKPNFFVRTLVDTKAILTSVGQSGKFIVICIVSLVLAVVGVVLSLTLNNPFLIPAFILGFISIPFIFVRTYSYSYQRHLRRELELALSQITVSYMRTDDILKAVEENIPNINPPVREVFEGFVSQIKYINPNIRQAIDDMANKIGDSIFHEWCECLKRCNQNRTLKYMLTPVVDKYATLREISGEIQDQLNSYKVEYFIFVGILYGNYPLVYLLEKEWFKVLVVSVQGLALTGFITFVTVLCTIILSFILKPLDFDI